MTQEPNEVLNASETEKNTPDDSTVAEGGEVASVPANLQPGDAIEPKSTHHVVCQEEMDRISDYAKRVKMTPWSEDVLWLVEQLTHAVMILNENERKVEVFKQALHKLTNGGFEKLREQGLLWTEQEDKVLTAVEKDQRMMDFLHKQVCCKCGKTAKKKTEEAKQ